MGEDGEADDRAGQNYMAAAPYRPVAQADGEQHQVAADGLRVGPETEPTAQFHAQLPGAGPAHQGRQQRGGGGFEGREVEQSRAGVEAEREQKNGEILGPQEEGQQRDGFAESEVAADHEQVGKRLVPAGQRQPRGGFGAPEIEGRFAALHGLHHALNEGVVGDAVVVAITGGDQFGGEHDGLNDGDEQQERQAEALFGDAHEFPI